ncbi:class I adenylate-forming enzyme family protein [Streptosporangium sp. NPDC000509]|uniref:class I adenylate-forming enzyme family protein n=1 Tax=Streptosporangium sp. NPDC000509 TaxID=3366186 RepID=UPI0036A77D96
MILRNYLSAAVRRHGARPAVVAGGRIWSYADLNRMSRAVAGHLQECGVGPGDPVAIILRNGVEYVVADLAITLLGAAKVPVNLMLSTDEQAYIVADSDARVCLVEADRLDSVHAARALGADPQVVVHSGDGGPGSWDEAVAHAPLAEEPAVPPEAHALIMYTGGTTGRPKGVVHTQRGIAANLLTHLVEMEIFAEDVLLLTSPLPHSAGFLLQAALTKGASVFVEEGFEVDVVLERIGRDRVTYLFLVPTMIYRVLDAAEKRTDVDTTSVRTILYGAAPIAVERLEQGLRTFGQVFMQLYGQSEAPNFLTRLRRDDHQPEHATHRLSSCGQAVAMARVEIHDDDGAVCGSGEVGEIVAFTPYTMEGYLNRAAETAEALRSGWLHTGDLGYLDDDGYLYLVDRKKDMIITGGLNVYSAEVEQVLARVPGVREVAVTGIPHPDWGEAVVGFVVPDHPDVSADEIRSAAHVALTSYKRPKEVVIVPSLPVTAVGKIDKKKLRQEWAGW